MIQHPTVNRSKGLEQQIASWSVEELRKFHSRRRWDEFFSGEGDEFPGHAVEIANPLRRWKMTCPF